jgi:phage shock protein PspC (stress-responsive transcriptional regulator)
LKNNIFSKPLYRSKTNKIAAGVCGGLAEYFDIDALFLRIIWVLSVIFGGLGLLFYLAAYIIVPENPETIDQQTAVKEKPESKRAFFWGALLIVLGVILLVQNWGLFNYLTFISLPWHGIWAVILILIGLYLIFRTNASPAETGYTKDNKQIYRSSEDKMIGGVCAGLAAYFNIDKSIMRLAYLLLSLASLGMGIIAYIVMYIVFPEKDMVNANLTKADMGKGI